LIKVDKSKFFKKICKHNITTKQFDFCGTEIIQILDADIESENKENSPDWVEDKMIAQVRKTKSGNFYFIKD
jgi:hypothetical protein